MDFDSELVRSREARLFPTVRISSSKEAELRATASLLATLRAVSEFGRAIIKASGGPAGRLSCYTEVPLKSDVPDAKELRPDGVIRVLRGSTDWRAMVEAKVGDCDLDAEQVNEYHRIAKDHGFSVLITISNQAALSDGLPPISLDGRRLKSVAVVHFSWDRLLSEARMLSQKSEIADSDQCWMLSEWIKYVADPDSRIIEPPQLGEHWGDIVRAARESNLPSVAKYVYELAPAWDGYLRKECLRLRAKLGVEVESRIPLSERKDPDARFKRIAQEVFAEGCLRGQVRVPDAASELSIELNIAAGLVRFGAELQAPQEGRQQTRITWLLKQLRNEQVPADMVVKVEWDRKNLRTLGKAGELRVSSSGLMFDGHQLAVPSDALPRRFVLEWTRKLDKTKGKSTTGMLKGISDDLEAFYGSVVERLVGYVASAPKLPKEPVATVAAPPSMEPPMAGSAERPIEVDGESSPLAYETSSELGPEVALAAAPTDESNP